MRKRCSFGLLFVSINLCVCVFPFWQQFEGGVWALVVLDPDHCLSFYFAKADGTTLKSLIASLIPPFSAQSILCVGIMVY